MSQSTKQKAASSDVRTAHAGDSESDSLTEIRGETDRLFAVAAKSFAAMSEGNSRQFLRRSQQTGGQ